MTFESLGLSDPLMKAVRKSGYVEPTPIQQKAIPIILRGSDVTGVAQTGTGKTAGFTLPLLQLLGNRVRSSDNRIRALILTPTRELAAQIQKSVSVYSRYLKLSSMSVYGGVGIKPQKEKLKRGVDVLVATPGRLLDLFEQNAIVFEALEIFVLDEADRMLDMGFIRDIKHIASLLPKNRQNLMFSATFPSGIRKLAKSIVTKPVEVNVCTQDVTLEEISEKFYSIAKSRKTELIIHLIRKEGWYQVLIFVRTKRGADKLVRSMRKESLESVSLHGSKSQAQRTRILDDFKRNKIQILIATDIAARGIDISELSHVANFDLPSVPEDYVHRIGRTGRAGSRGKAISFVSPEDIKLLRGIEKYTKSAVVLEEVTGFQADHNVKKLVAEKKKPRHSPKRCGRSRQ